MSCFYSTDDTLFFLRHFRSMQANSLRNAAANLLRFTYPTRSASSMTESRVPFGSLAASGIR